MEPSTSSSIKVVGTIATRRIQEELKAWRCSPLPNYRVRLAKNEDGSLNLFEWHCILPGEKGTWWDLGKFLLRITFPEDFPMNPPTCKFPAGFYHPNVFWDGLVCHPLTSTEWSLEVRVKDILLQIQHLLAHPNLDNAVNPEAYITLTEAPWEYKRRIQDLVVKSFHHVYHQPRNFEKILAVILEEDSDDLLTN